MLYQAKIDGTQWKPQIYYSCQRPPELFNCRHTDGKMADRWSSGWNNLPHGLPLISPAKPELYDNVSRLDYTAEVYNLCTYTPTPHDRLQTFKQTNICITNSYVTRARRHTHTQAGRLVLSTSCICMHRP